MALRSSEQVDLWAVGCLLHELLTGDTPFWEANQHIESLVLKICRFDMPTFHGMHVGPQERELLNQLLVRDPDERLGARPHGYRAVIAHPWFQEIPETHVLHKQLVPPWVPYIHGNPTHHSATHTPRPPSDTIMKMAGNHARGLPFSREFPSAEPKLDVDSYGPPVVMLDSAQLEDGYHPDPTDVATGTGDLPYESFFASPGSLLSSDDEPPPPAEATPAAARLGAQGSASATTDQDAPAAARDQVAPAATGNQAAPAAAGGQGFASASDSQVLPTSEESAAGEQSSSSLTSEQASERAQVSASTSGCASTSDAKASKVDDSPMTVMETSTTASSQIPAENWTRRAM